MANQFLNSMTDLWQSSGTAYSAIKMNVTNAASAGDGSTTDQTLMSKLLQLQLGSVDKFAVDKLGNVRTAGTIYGAGVISSGASAPLADDGAALGASGKAWSDLFLAGGGVINWNQNDVSITHATNALAFAGASLGYSFDALIKPLVNDGSALGVAGTAWSDLFLAIGAEINYGNGNTKLVHSDLALTVGPGDLRVTTAGGNSASVVTVGGTQTLTGKTLSSATITTATLSAPTITGAPTAGGATWTDLGTVTTCTINGGTINNTVIGGVTPKAITGTTVSGASASFTTVTGTTSITSPTATHATSVFGGKVQSAQIFESIGTNVILAPAAGLNTIYLRPRGQADATGQVTIDNAGSITTPGSVGVTGNVNCNDLYSVRTASPTTGVVFLGNSGHYLFFDGSGYSMPSGALTVGGTVSANGAVYAVGAFMNTDGNISGSVWTNLGYGDAYTAIVNRIETRGSAWGAAHVANAVTSWRCAGEVANDRNGVSPKRENSAYFHTGIQGLSSGGDGRYYARQPQLYTTNGGWVAAFIF